MAANASVTQINTNLRRRSYTPTVMNGKNVYESNPPEMNLALMIHWITQVKKTMKSFLYPKMWAKLSTQGKSPATKRKATVMRSRPRARQGVRSSGQACNTSTQRQASKPKCEPDGPTWRNESKNLCLKNILFVKERCRVLIKYLGSVWHKQGRGEVANDTGAHVDNADA